eukprot:1811197-Pyramimonas_sp.AAC.1
MCIWWGYTIQRSREALSTTRLHTRACVPSRVPTRFLRRGRACAYASRPVHRRSDQSQSDPPPALIQQGLP